jgi:hypothetical protein
MSKGRCLRLRDYPEALLMCALSLSGYLSVCAQAEDAIFIQSFQSTCNLKFPPNKTEPSVNVVKTTQQKQQTSALLNSGAWRMLGLSSFTSNDQRPSVADAVVFAKRVGAEYLSYEVTSQGIQTMTQVVAHPQYVEGQTARLDLTSNVPGAGPVNTTGTYSTAPHINLNPTLERVRVHRYLHMVYYLKRIAKK